jgi:predicted nucleic acid-binding protein
LIAAEKGRLDLGGMLAALGHETAVIAAITASELLHGVERAEPARLKERRSQFVEWTLAHFDVVDFGVAEARIHAQLWDRLSAEGQPIGCHDLLVAATALRLGFSLATFNAKEFRRVAGLSLLPV